VVFGHPAPGVVPRLEVEQVLERPALRRVEVALHIAVGDPRAPGEPRGERHGLVFEAHVGDDAIHDPECQGLLSVHDVCGEVELARLRGADELGEEPAAAEVARVADARERRREARRVGSDTEVARERERQARAGRRAPHHRDRRLRHLVEPPRHFHARAEPLCLLLERGPDGLAPLRHRLHVPARAEAAAGAREHDDPDLGVGREPGERLEQRVEHWRPHRVQAAGPVQREHRDFIFKFFEQLLAHGILRRRMCGDSTIAVAGGEGGVAPAGDGPANLREEDRRWKR